MHFIIDLKNSEHDYFSKLYKIISTSYMDICVIFTYQDNNILYFIYCIPTFGTRALGSCIYVHICMIE